MATKSSSQEENSLKNKQKIEINKHLQQKNVNKILKNKNNFLSFSQINNNKILYYGTMISSINKVKQKNFVNIFDFSFFSVSFFFVFG